MSRNDVIDKYADKDIQFTCRLIGEHVLFEGEPEAFEFLGDLFKAHATSGGDCNFDLTPFGAGSSWFSKSSNRGIMLHRLPCENGEIRSSAPWSRPDLKTIQVEKAKFSEILQRVLSLWPKSIDLSKGYLINETKGYHSKDLNDAHEKAEQYVDPSNEFDLLMVWVIFGVLHKKAKAIAVADGKKQLMLDEVSIEEFRASYSEALAPDDWLEFRNLIEIDA